ncbi:MAG: tetratricopeptide repeat protein [Patescibacteria group bacterium]
MKKTLFFSLLICSAIVAIYAQTLKFDFVSLDEEDHLANRQYFLSSVKNIPEAFQHNTYYPNGTSQYYRPLHTISFMLDAIGDITPSKSHAINIVLHMGAALLLFWFMRELGIGKTASFFLALLFAVHPIGSRIVGWVPGRNDATFAIFAIASCIAYLRWVAHPERWWLMAVHLVLFFAAFLSKELGIVLPILYVLMPRNYVVSRKHVGLVAGGWILIVIFWWLMRSEALAGTVVTAWNDLLLGLFPNTVAIPFYLQISSLPLHPSVMPTMQDALHWLPIVVSGAFIAILIVLGKRFQPRSNLLLFGIAWFLLFLLPSLAGYGSDIRLVLFEHRAYVPLMGLLFIAAAFPWGRMIPFSRSRRFILAGAVVAVYGVFAFLGTRDFRDALTFWEKAVAQAPDYAGSHKGLGTVYVNRGRFDDAVNEFQKALELNPTEKRVHNNLGIIYLNQRRVQEAEMEFLSELDVNPGYAITYNNLGFVYATQKRFADAEKAWLTALVFDPWYAAPHQGLAIIYAIANNKEQSLAHIEALVKLGAPLSPDIQKIYESYR